MRFRSAIYPATALALVLAVSGCGRGSADQDRGGRDSAGGTAGAPDSAAAAALATSVNGFALDLHRALPAGEASRIVSPFSVSAAMGLAYAGAAGATRLEMQRVLRLPPSDEAAFGGYQALFAGLDARAGEAGAQWTLANRMWVQQGYALQDSFVRVTRESFRSELGQADFQRAPEPARAEMNRWVEEQTRQRIRDLFPQGSITPDTRLVLANAIYFKGLWDKPFQKNATQDTPFHVSAGVRRPVPMMNRTGEYGWAAVPGAHLLELPYRGGRLSMLVILPDAVDGLAALESRLDADSLRAWTGRLQEREVTVGLPRFRAESAFELSRALAGLGMASAFDPDGADFSRISGRRDLFVSAVMHKAFVDVNEEGTEAAAATGAVMQTTSARIPERFVCDHPFLFAIRDRATGCLIFLGRYGGPAS